MTVLPRSVAERGRVADRSSRQFLPEIQALRAVAVTLVVVYHFWPRVLTGGFVGVDAFFVISGFLITSHLLREADRTGTVRLWAFYARRVRRLLPASVFVLLFVGLGTFLLLPTDLWSATAKEVTASGFYVENLWLASKAVTYSASNDVASPVTHYWSLSAEEQFYLLWPGLIILSCLGARRWLRGRTTTTVGVTLLAVTACSFAFSVWATQAHRAAAYFITATRAWEFGAGALVVLLMRRWGPSLFLSRVLRWLGLGGLLAAGWFYSGATPFPGYAAALPVLATAAVIVAGDTGRADPSDRVFRLRQVQWLGDVSYSVYLWHWPLLVFAPYIVRHPLGTPELVVLLVICLGVSGLSKRYVEDGTRYWPRLRLTSRATLCAAAVAMVVIALVSGTQIYAAGVQEQENAALLADVSARPCFGAPAMENRARCPDAVTALPLVAVTKVDAPWAAEPGCHGTATGADVVQTCFWGTGKPTRVVALVGDSHAQAWRAAMHRIAKARNWQLIELFAGGCPANASQSIVFKHRTDAGQCPEWTTKTTGRLRALAPDDIITTAFAQQNVFQPAGSGPAGFERVWRDWLVFSRVTVLRDIPTTASRNGPQCLAINADRPQACANPRAAVLVDDDLMRAARAMRGEVNLIDLSDHFCDARRCYAVIGGASIYYDDDHMSNQFSASLAWAFLREMPPI